MDVLERNYKFYFNIYEFCSPSETSAAMFVCTQTFAAFEKDSQMVQFISFPFSAGAERPVPFVEKLLPKIPFKW